MNKLKLTSRASTAWIGCCIFLGLLGCASPNPDTPVRLQIADGLPVAFRPDTLLTEMAGWQRLDNGRLLIRRVSGPEFQQQPRVTAEVTLRSAGDPWDKSGLLCAWPDDPGTRAAIEQGLAPSAPAIELLRFITPFGVGHFSDGPRADEYRPVYIPRWADSVQWTADLTSLLPVLEGPFFIGLFIDTWSGDGHVVDAALHWTPTAAELHTKQSKVVVPVMNTTKLFADQTQFTAFADGPVSTEFTLTEPLANAKLHLTTTGHGGHSSGDEFTPCEHIVLLNEAEIDRFTPWRDDCASFRRFNPSAGVWTEKTLWRGDSIEERIASSDYSRSGWCPGSDVPARLVDLGQLPPGTHKLTIEIPTAQPYADTAQNFFNVAAHIVGNRQVGKMP